MAGATTSMTIRMDRTVKEESQQLFKSLGLDMTTAINIFLRQSLIAHGLPFSVTTHETSPRLWKKLQEAEEDKDIHGPFQTVDELMEDLNT